jgi:hypothetical protein
LQQAQEESARFRDDNEKLRGELTDLESQLRAQADVKAVMAVRADEKNLFEAVPVVTQEELRSEVPVYNLAEQIMSEHRRSVGARRLRVEPSGSKGKGESIKDVVKQYVDRPVSPKPAASCYDLWNDDSLTSFQQELLQEIAQKDILKYCG